MTFVVIMATLRPKGEEAAAATRRVAAGYCLGKARNAGPQVREKISRLSLGYLDRGVANLFD